MKTCSLCDRPVKSRGLCHAHYERQRKHGDPLHGGPVRRRRGTGSVHALGYRTIQRDGVRRLEHRAIMEELLGRPLRPDETVHHRNGIRHDNRPANLELWLRQPPGQRVDDLVAFVLHHYPDRVRAAQLERLHQ